MERKRDNNMRSLSLIRYADDFVILHENLDVTKQCQNYYGDTIYWAQRMGKHPELKTQKARLPKKQKGKCNWCKLSFQEGDNIENDRIIPLKARGNNSTENCELFHKHCHDIKTKDEACKNQNLQR